MTVARPVRLMALSLLMPLLLTACSGGANGPRPHLFEEGTSSLNATVEAVDQPARKVTLRTDSGSPVTFAVDDRVKNLAKVKVGDRVKVAYYESVAVQVRDPRAADGGAAMASASFGDWEQAPDGTVGRQSTITAVVESVDRKKGTVALRGPAGKVRVFQVRDARNLENVNPGDEVTATHREVMAVAIKPVEP